MTTVNLTPAELVPEEFLELFPFASFNSVQAATVKNAFRCDENMVIAAPTGSGKTVLHELAICRLFLKKQGKNIKCVYIAPSKALCQQRWSEWNQKFGKFGLKVLEVTGDIDLKECLKMVAMASIIITTPEKFDSLTRIWRDHVYLMSATDLLLLDEIHHLGEDRGPTLEAVIVRMRCLGKIRPHNGQRVDMNIDFVEAQKLPSSSVRIIALSATLPNLADIGEWLDCQPEYIHYFDNTHRPVPLRTECFAYGNAHNIFLFERSLDCRVADLIRRYSSKKQVLIFCSSKKNAESLAIRLRGETSSFYNGVGNLYQGDLLNHMQDEVLKGLIMDAGIGYHHAGLPADDRMIVEQLYLNGYIHVLCSTSTLAHGVNLPAHLVIVKGTYCWRGSSKWYERLKRSDVIQMLGRAGRPGYDEFGVAIIMTNDEDRKYYENNTLSADVVKSSLPTMLPEALTSEISQRLIVSLDGCIAWLKATFFYTCLMKGRLSPPYGPFTSNEQVDQFIHDLALKMLGELKAGKLIQMEEDTGVISPNMEAHIMSKNLTKFKSMLHLMAIPSRTPLQQLIHSVPICEELHKPVRRLEKKLLNDLMKEVRFPSKDRVQQPPQKSFVLIQAAVGRKELKDFTLRIEQAEIIDNTIRLLHCLRDLCIQHEYGMLLESTILLERALHMRIWEGPQDTMNVFLQCKDLSEKLVTAIGTSELRNYYHVYHLTMNQIQQQLHCTTMEARAIAFFTNDLIHGKMIVDYEIDYDDDNNRKQLHLKVYPAMENNNSHQANLHLNNNSNNERNQAITYQLICYLVDSSKLLLHRHVTVNSSRGNDDNHSEVIAEYRVPWLWDDRLLGNVRCCLYANVAGIDCIRGAPITLAVQQPTTTNTYTTRGGGGGRSSTTSSSSATAVQGNNSGTNSNNSNQPEGGAVLDADKVVNVQRRYPGVPILPSGSSSSHRSVGGSSSTPIMPIPVASSASFHHPSATAAPFFSPSVTSTPAPPLQKQSTAKGNSSQSHHLLMTNVDANQQRGSYLFDKFIYRPENDLTVAANAKAKAKDNLPPRMATKYPINSQLNYSRYQDGNANQKDDDKKDEQAIDGEEEDSDGEEDDYSGLSMDTLAPIPPTANGGKIGAASTLDRSQQHTRTDSKLNSLRSNSWSYPVSSQQQQVLMQPPLTYAQSQQLPLPPSASQQSLSQYHNPLPSSQPQHAMELGKIRRRAFDMNLYDFPVKKLKTGTTAASVASSSIASSEQGSKSNKDHYYSTYFAQQYPQQAAQFQPQLQPQLLQQQQPQLQQQQMVPHLQPPAAQLPLPLPPLSQDSSLCSSQASSTSFFDVDDFIQPMQQQSTAASLEKLPATSQPSQYHHPSAAFQHSLQYSNKENDRWLQNKSNMMMVGKHSSGDNPHQQRPSSVATVSPTTHYNRHRHGPTTTNVPTTVNSNTTASQQVRNEQAAQTRTTVVAAPTAAVVDQEKKKKTSKDFGIQVNEEEIIQATSNTTPTYVDSAVQMDGTDDNDDPTTNNDEGAVVDDDAIPLECGTVFDTAMTECGRQEQDHPDNDRDDNADDLGDGLDDDQQPREEGHNKEEDEGEYNGEDGGDEWILKGSAYMKESPRQFKSILPGLAASIAQDLLENEFDEAFF